MRMNRLFLGCCLAAAGLVATADAQTLITFQTRAEPNTIAGVSVDPNISGGTLSRGPGVLNNAGGTFNSNSWQEGSDLGSAIANNNYITFTVDVASGAQATVDQIFIRYDRSGTGPNQIAILSSVTGFTAAATPVFTDTAVSEAGENNTIPVSSHTMLAGTIEFRVYGWGATGSAGTFDIEVIDAANAPGVGIVVNGSTSGGGGPTGACCIAGGCSLTAAANCSGAFQGEGTSCSPNPCPQPVGACCVNSFCVGELTEPNCLANGTGSVWGGVGTTCGTFVCPDPIGSCCIGPACTANVSSANCGSQGGIFTLNGTCSPNLCDDGACCNATFGSCRVTFTPADCDAVGGTFTAGGTCTPNPCPQPAGACCLPDSTCVVNLAGLDCRAQNGVYLGVSTTCAPSACVRATGANLVARYDFDVNVVGGGSRNLSFATSVNPPFPTGDQFGVAQRYVDTNLPFGLLDDTLFAFPTDAQGIIAESKVDSWFGSVDLFDLISPTGTATATWTFSIAGFTGLSLSIDMAAMGDFENAPLQDKYEFSASIDGGDPFLIFAVIADEAGSQTYTLASGVVTDPINDPLVVSGVGPLNNVFQTLTAAIPGTGDVLTLTLTATTDGADEAFAIDNIILMGTTGSAQGACCLTGGSCTLAGSALCTGTLNGTYQGDGTTCSPNPCQTAATGACCSGSTCSVTTAAACVGTLARYAGNGTVCNVPGNSTTPCCKADYNQSGSVTVQDIFDFLSGYFSQDARADINAVGGVTVQDIFDFLAAYFAGCN